MKEPTSAENETPTSELKDPTHEEHRTGLDNTTSTPDATNLSFRTSDMKTDRSERRRRHWMLDRSSPKSMLSNERHNERPTEMTSLDGLINAKVKSMSNNHQHMKRYGCGRRDDRRHSSSQ